jgi:hypothetical protein
MKKSTKIILSAIFVILANIILGFFIYQLIVALPWLKIVFEWLVVVALLIWTSQNAYQIFFKNKEDGE